MSPTATNTGGVAMQVRRPDRFRSRETRAGYARVWIACTVFLILLAAGWMIGTKFHLKSSDQTVKISPAERTKGRIVAATPDGVSCTYTSFDNVTQKVSAPTTALCEAIVREQSGRPGFQWGRNNSQPQQ